MAKTLNSIDELVEIKALLQYQLAIELWRGGLPQSEIGKRLGIAKASVNKMLKGVSREALALSVEEN